MVTLRDGGANYIIHNTFSKDLSYQGKLVINNNYLTLSQ